MALKTKSRAKAAKPAKAAKKKILKIQSLSPTEVVELERQVVAQKNSENSWQEMTSPPGEDKWGAVEEKLVQKPIAQAHSERRWKYFSK